MILIFSSIFDHYKYALAFFPFMHVPFQEQPKSLHSSQQHILVRLCMCVTEQPCPLFHPEKTEIFRLHPASSLSNTPPTHLSLRLHPALIRPCSHAGKMTERGKREWRGRERGEKDVTAPQQVWRTGERESEGEKEREKKRESYSDDELLAMGGGRDICGIKRCWSLVKHALTCRSHFAHTHTHTLS